MKTVGIYFFSKYGQTKKIALRLATELEHRGLAPILFDGALRARRERLQDCDSYLFCGAIYGGRYDKRLVSLLTRNRDILANRTCGVVSVSLSANGSDKQKAEAAGVAERFFTKLAWEPSYVAHIAGALNYTKYNPLIRWVMRRISEKSGGPVDTSREYEFTNWSELANFAVDFSTEASDSRYAYEQRHPENVHMNELMPVFDVMMSQEVRIAASRRNVFDALTNLQPSDMPLATFLAKMRTLFGARSETNAKGFLQASSEFGVVPLFEERERELIGGLVGRFWQLHFGIKRLQDRESFTKFSGKNYAKVASGFYLADMPDGTCVLRAQTRVFGTDEKSRRNFGRYWFFLGLGIKLYMKSLLAGAKRRSERMERQLNQKSLPPVLVKQELLKK